ncbi:MAG: DUF190 domain-containing protein [Spirochaetia bacterium]|jgi:PII-like signaling protein|nr:DUF190 domain-containing protein [Spirochaetia bacterium]
MTVTDSCQLLRVYVSEDTRYKGHSLYNEVVFLLKGEGICGVTVYRGIAGYGEGKVLHTTRFIEMSSSLPIIIEAVDTKEKITAALPKVKEMVMEGLVIVQDIQLISYGKANQKETK